MRGGFVAGLGNGGGLLDRAAGALRWHRGCPQRYQHKGLEITVLADPRDGPFVECEGGRIVLVHGCAPAPLEQLQLRQSRFVALQWDGHVLRVCRDPLGLAPLFYRLLDGALWLATEIHPLIALQALAPDLEALTAQAAFVPSAEATGWQGIRRVLSGSTLEVSGGLHISVSRYWFPAEMIGCYRGGAAQAREELRHRFQTAVERCFEANGAILLSGGLDSAAIAMTASANGKSPPHLVHVHFPTLAVTDEERYARSVADAVGAPLHTVAGEIGPWNPDREFDTLGVPDTWLPFGIEEPAYTEIAAAGVSVALDGHDADGVLGILGGGEWGALVLDGEVRKLSRLIGCYGLWPAMRGIAADFLPPAWRLARLRGLTTTYGDTVARYFHEPFAQRIRAADLGRWRWPSELWTARQLQPLVPQASIPFEQKEIEAARHGIDIRHPFADRDLVDFLISLPCGIKSDPVRPKYLMLEALGDVLPSILQTRPRSDFSDYMSVVSRRVAPAACVEAIRSSGVRFPHISYQRLFADGGANLAMIPIYLLINLTRIHEFVRRAG